VSGVINRPSTLDLAPRKLVDAAIAAARGQG
jgi:hypothetical protein